MPWRSAPGTAGPTGTPGWRETPASPGTPGFVPVELAQTGPRRFTLRADLVHESRPGRTDRTDGSDGADPDDGPDDGPAVVVVPAGFTTDLASVPFPLWALVGPFGRHTRAAILHDYGCSLLSPPLRTPEQYRRRAAVDLRFREALLDSDVPRLRAWLMWAAVGVGRVVVHGSPVRVGALAVQLAVGLVLLAFAVAPGGGAWRVAALLAPLALSLLWRREWPVLAIAHYAGALVLPALVVNVVTGGVLALLGLGWRGRAGDILPTRVGDD